ncbi:unnamed protein product [Cuscuta campestris]|uniref:Uncharacterized protein n=1 Tax=Cuscuta campestris TaxID=132261 RepID=A0A484LHY6_9ASTE|nr:unnamed protein product [Cuscuta campestris]
MMKLPYRSSESCNLQIHLLYFYPINPIWWIQASKAMMDLPVILNFTATQTHKGFNIVRVTPITGYVKF